MNELDPWKIWAVTGALVCLILCRAETCVRPNSANNGVVHASTLTGETRATSASTAPTQWPDQYESYSSVSSQRIYSRITPSNFWQYNGVAASSAASRPALVTVSVTDEISATGLDVTQELADNESVPVDESELVTMDDPGRRVIGWFAAGNEGKVRSELEISDSNGWSLPVTMDDTISLAWQNPEVIADDFPNTLLVDGRYPIDLTGSLDVNYLQGSNKFPALYVGDRTSLSRMLSDANYSGAGISQLVQLADSGESEDAAEIVNEMRTQAAEQLLVQAAVEQEGFPDYLESGPIPPQGAGWPDYEVRAINYW